MELDLAKQTNLELNKEMDCLFCKIISGKIPSNKVFENENVFAFKDIHPKAPIHYLFVPKKHYESLASLPVTELNEVKEIFRAVKELADKEGISKEGYKTIINTGRGGGQEVFHLHVHLLSGF